MLQVAVSTTRQAQVDEFVSIHSDGSLQAGRVAALDTLASQFFAVPTSRAQLYEEASSLGQNLGESAKYYLKVMEKLANGTDAFVEKEAKRYVSIVS